MPEAVVVGAGPGGLAAAAMLQRAGVETLVVDRADAVAAAWRGHYERLHLHTVRWLSHLPGYKIPRRYGKWVARDDVVRYLEDYAEHHRLDVKLQTEITRIDRDGDHWILRSPQRDLSATYVVVANGHNHTPDLPDWPGTFNGEVLHASAYRNATPYVGKDVVVVGSGNTGAEIALDLVETGAASVKVAIRTPPHIVFREQNGVVNPVFGVLFRYFPPRIFDPIARKLRDATVGDLTPLGLPAPAEGLLERVLRDDAIPLVDMGFLDALKAGRLSVIAAVVGFSGDEVLLADGTAITADAVIAATGYQRGLAPIVGHLGVLRADGRPRARGGHTEQHAPNLWFTGFTNPISGMFRELGIDAKKIARAVVRQRRSGLVDTLRVTAPRVIPGKEPVGR
ncbi:MAG: NAD(P)/FAD-dependent oxidoreductase [Frankiaceae bacterium]|nr:NAD(P)/FAD-dependent oxidoreductase [Frankiaceae bacterium]MBV9871627.1 NAD(P)/FAD-dependent oxidoreductase [Frankiaceae bacterium]